MHKAYWPWGRGNHYYFDLNRDYIYGTAGGTMDASNVDSGDIVVVDSGSAEKLTYMIKRLIILLTLIMVENLIIA